jgi:hypothetical protein
MEVLWDSNEASWVAKNEDGRRQLANIRHYYLYSTTQKSQQRYSRRIVTFASRIGTRATLIIRGKIRGKDRLKRTFFPLYQTTNNIIYIERKANSQESSCSFLTHV